ncbi:MAG: hypothetical protein GY720_14645 [bacterium]|nr:hypothetical protein [bacterium]
MSRTRDSWREAPTRGSSARPSGSTCRDRRIKKLTDSNGGPVFGDGSERDVPSAYEDVRLHDPYDPEPMMQGDPRLRTLNHSNYYRDPEYAATIGAFVARLSERERT